MCIIFLNTPADSQEYENSFAAEINVFLNTVAPVMEKMVEITDTVSRMHVHTTEALVKLLNFTKSTTWMKAFGHYVP